MTPLPPLAAPVPLTADHRLDAFSSGMPSLDEWLVRRALANQMAGATRSYVVTRAGTTDVVGYYAVAAGGIVANADLPGRFRRNMPAMIPVSILARLAVDRSCQGRGLGRALLRDALMRIEQASDQIGIRGILVEAISEDAKAFYASCGFTALKEPSLTLVATLADLRQAMGA